jgi:hypothetical protein
MRDMRQTLQGWNGNVEGKKKLKRDLLEEIDKLDRLSELNGLTAHASHFSRRLKLIVES